MSKLRNGQILTSLRIGIAAIMAVLIFAWACSSVTQPAAGAASAVADEQTKALKAEIAALKELLPDQSHAMSDVAYHASNLWFAGRAANWPLADFYWKETRSHLQWAVRIKPIRKDNANRDVNLPNILQSMENGPLKQLGEAIAAKSPQKFLAAYRFTLETCYSCHKASDKPYLRPEIPERPQVTIINFRPQANWPL